MKATWNYESSHDTGNGAMLHRATSPAYPGVVQFIFHSYCRREADRRWYEAAGDEDRKEFRSPAAAARWARQICSK